MQKKYDGKINVSLKWIIRILILTTIFFCMIKKEYQKVLILSMTLVLTYYEWLVKKKLKIELIPILEIAINLFIFGAQYLGTIMNWYGRFHWWDTMLHMISGIIFTYIGLTILEEINKRTSNVLIHISIKYMFGICFTLAVGVFWEFFEFIVDRYLNGNMQRALNEVGQAAILDTMTDLLSAFVGSVTAIFIETKKLRIKNERKK